MNGQNSGLHAVLASSLNVGDDNIDRLYNILNSLVEKSIVHQELVLGEESSAVKIGDLYVRRKEIAIYLNFVIHHKRTIGRVDKLSHRGADVSDIDPDGVMGGRAKFGDVTPLGDHIDVSKELLGALNSLELSGRGFRKSFFSLAELSNTG